MSEQAFNADTEWYSHPDRPCKGREEFADLKLLVADGRNTRKSQAQKLANECLTRCPVLKECRIDLLSYSNEDSHYGVQAGIIGKV